MQQYLQNTIKPETTDLQKKNIIDIENKKLKDTIFVQFGFADEYLKKAIDHYNLNHDFANKKNKNVTV